MFDWIRNIIFWEGRAGSASAPRTCNTCRWVELSTIGPEYAKCRSPFNLEDYPRTAVMRRIDPDYVFDVRKYRYDYCTTQRDGDGGGSCGTKGRWWESTHE